MNIFSESQNKQGMTVMELYNYLEEIMNVNRSSADLPVFLTETVVKRGQIINTIQHLKRDDIKIEDLNLNNNVVSLFDKGLVIGYIPTTDE